MGSNLTVSVSPSHNLTGLRMTPQADGSLRFTPTGRDFRQRLSIAALLIGLGGALAGLMLFIELKLPAPSPDAKREALLALRGIQCLGGVLALWGVLQVLTWFRKRLTLSVDGEGNLVLLSRAWVSRREAFPISTLQSITYGVRRHDIGRPDRGGYHSSKPHLTFWIWSVTLVVKPTPSDGEPRYERFDAVAQEAPPQPGSLPDEITMLCQWLCDRTGKPVRAMDEQRLQ